MNTIYLVTPTQHCWDDMLEGFATDSEGIREIIRNHVYVYLGIDCGPGICVDMEKMTATILDDDDCEETYYIREIERAAWTPST